jgi:hypothetical protein
MSRFSLDPPDDDAYDDVRYDGTDCADCGQPSVAWLCETCSDQREAWAAATASRMATALPVEIPANKISTVLPPSTNPHTANDLTKHDRSGWSVEVALVPVSMDAAGVVEVALVPIASVRVLTAADARELKRMARAFLSADLSNVKDVA